jgi:hypothetical protein
MRFETYKSRFAKIGTKVELEVPYNRGMSPFSGLIELLEDMGVIAKGTQPGEKLSYVCTITDEDGVIKDRVVFKEKELTNEIALRLLEHPDCQPMLARKEVEPSEEEIKEYEKSIPTPSVNERWDTYGLFCNMVASGVTKSMVSFGTGGVGKTYTLMQELSKLKLSSIINKSENEITYSDILELSNMEKVVSVINQSGIKKSSDFICKLLPIAASNSTNLLYNKTKSYVDNLISYLTKNENYSNSSEENIFKLICDYINSNPTKQNNGQIRYKEL